MRVARNLVRPGTRNARVGSGAFARNLRRFGNLSSAEVSSSAAAASNCSSFMPGPELRAEDPKVSSL